MDPDSRCSLPFRQLLTKRRIQLVVRIGACSTMKMDLSHTICDKRGMATTWATNPRVKSCRELLHHAFRQSKFPPRQYLREVDVRFECCIFIFLGLKEVIHVEVAEDSFGCSREFILAVFSCLT